MRGLPVFLARLRGMKEVLMNIVNIGSVVAGGSTGGKDAVGKNEKVGLFRSNPP